MLDLGVAYPQHPPGSGRESESRCHPVCMCLLPEFLVAHGKAQSMNVENQAPQQSQPHVQWPVLQIGVSLSPGSAL